MKEKIDILSKKCTRNGVKKDVLFAGILASFLFILMYNFLGFAKSGIDAPYCYVGCDDFSELASYKRTVSGEQWATDSLGAPYNASYESFPTEYMTRADALLKKIIGIFSKDPAIGVNMFFLLIFPLCGLSSYFSLRALKIRRDISIFGALVFALAPFITARNITHLVLSSCFFVPFSILLCAWSAQGEENYLQLKKGFFRNSKNIVTVILAIFIASNGIGYYPIFTCFFLVIVAIYRLLSERSWKSIKQPCVVIGIISCVFILELIPCLLLLIKGGNITSRHLQESEIYGLKIVQMFMPLNTHGNQLLQKIVNEYNSSAPLVNENTSAYLGVCSLIGFIISLCAMFGSHKTAEDIWNSKVRLFSIMNICAVLFATVGGFCVLFSMIFHQLRAFNRISIFILFISDAVLCICLQRYRNSCRTSRKRLLFHLILSVLTIICFYDQLPTWGANDSSLAASREAYQSDAHFVADIEKQLQPDDCVYQLPYHKFPEAGAVNNMNDYQLYAGYIHSNTLKWSYGGMKGQESDQWHEMVSLLGMNRLLQVIIPAGFRGIYIDTRAYSPECLAELQAEIETEIQTPPSASENGLLLFYNLYPYLGQHPELLQDQIYTAEEIQKIYSLISIGESASFDRTKQDAHRFFTGGISATEDHFAWTDGKEAEFIAYIDEEIENDLILEISYQGIFHGPQRMIVTCGDQLLYDQAQSNSPDSAVIPIPASCIADRTLNLKLQFPNALSPVEAGESADARVLALALTSLKLDYADGN